MGTCPTSCYDMPVPNPATLFLEYDALPTELTSHKNILYRLVIDMEKLLRRTIISPNKEESNCKGYAQKCEFRTHIQHAFH